MGQKVNPILFRMTNNEAFNHLSSWSCANKVEYKNFVVEDAKIRNYFNSIKQSSFISSISIERKNYIAFYYYLLLLIQWKKLTFLVWILVLKQLNLNL